MTVEEIFQAAYQRHMSGNLREAETLYRTRASLTPAHCARCGRVPPGDEVSA
jgi:hypothetical protein